jgi:hypothetical protein
VELRRLQEFRQQAEARLGERRAAEGRGEILVAAAQEDLRQHGEREQEAAEAEVRRLAAMVTTVADPVLDLVPSADLAPVRLVLEAKLAAATRALTVLRGETETADRELASARTRVEEEIRRILFAPRARTWRRKWRPPSAWPEISVCGYIAIGQ